MGALLMAETAQPTVVISIQTSPLALRREAAAAMLSISPSQFDLWVKCGIMPPPKRMGKKLALWDTKKIEAAYAVLIGDDEIEGDRWDQVSL